MTEELNNARQFPKMFYCRHMQPGTCGYQEEKNEVILVDTDCLKRMISTGSGKPVYIGHPGNSVVERLKNIKSESCGYIADSFYNEVDGWAWFKFLAIDDKAIEMCETPGMAVSNAYAAFSWGGEGTKNNVPYKRELLSGEFTQLAIVPNPRYEGACIMTPEEFKAYQENKKLELEELHNSKPEKETTPMFFRTKKEEVKAGETIGDDVYTEITNDDGTKETVKVKDLIELKRDELKNAKMKKNESDKEYNIDGEMVTQDMLEDCYKNMKKNMKKEKKNEKKNEEDEADEDDKAKLKKEDEEKKNAEDEAKKKKEKEEEEDEEKTNSKFYEELSNANRRAETAPPPIQTSMNQLQRGKSKYGTKK